MDVAALTALLSQSTDRLSSLHAEIGHPPNALQDALELLHQALKGAVDGQIAKVEGEAQGLKAECDAIHDDIAHLRSALGDNSATQPNNTAAGRRIFSNASSSSSSSSYSSCGLTLDAAELAKLPLLQRKSQLSSDRQRIKALYTSKEAHVERLLNKLETYRPLLGTYVRTPPRAAPPSSGPGSLSELKDVSQSCISAIEAEIIRCSKEVNQRIERLRNSLHEITRLWTELVLEPCRPLDLGDEGVFGDSRSPDDLDCGGAPVSFDRAVLAHLQLRPLYNDAGIFEGEFASTEGEEQDGADDGDRTARDIEVLESTPTRASFGGRPAKHSGEMAFRLPSRTTPSSANATLALPNHQMDPSEANLDLAARRVGWLEAEKHRREALIQNLYDELAELWAKFDVPEEEMDAFVMDHRGSTLDVIASYQSELDKMRALKAQHMSLFILKTRERIATLWDALFLTPEEREASFPPYFIDVSPEGAPDHDEPLPTDEILASHEQMIDYLTEQVRTKAPVLKVIGKYKELLDDERQLAESAADGARLLGRGSRGDPGRLLREEKMRKRVKVQKPRMESELQKVIPAWEQEHGEPFTINGVRYLDELLDQIEGSKENQNRKRPRPGTASGPTPQTRAQSALGRTPAIGSGRGSVAQTPLRPITPSLSTATTTKKARVGPAASTGLATKTPRVGPAASTGLATKTPRTTAGPPSRVTSMRQASSAVRQPSTVGRPGTSMSSYRNFSNQSSHAATSPSRIPMPSSPPKTSTRNFASQSTDSGYGSRNVTGSSMQPKKVPVQVPRESFRPRPSGNLRAHLATAAAKGADGAAPAAAYAQAVPVMSPGRISKWGEMGPPRWPVAQAAAGEEMDTAGRIPSSISVATSVHSDATTLIHPRPNAAAPVEEAVRREPGKKYRRAPSMSLETCLANLAASSSASASKRRLGDGMVDDGICSIRSISSSNSIAELAEDGSGPAEGERISRIHGWKDGLRFAGAVPEADTETETEDEPSETEQQQQLQQQRQEALPRSGSNNWSVVDEDEDLSRCNFAGSATAAV
ncbi:uncharacterized protein PFL1_03566 [Pseudozyma flocculosa PF-1]|uniref:Related to ASE1 - mitotic spindle midzone localized MAP family member n=2 Tax=Pseudozyma flocculosa TaxID=84751 RepID=A0A5C3F7T4_9BASI|nr:uncharacterized protein PFL1_03566 [Pseudozyma flocculosa PF-1]EPQ28763.1 hypothetical protein PFL1_03566 [Pseudozyma flocculosa PF-1]SPO39459.1 related to ASE1 - mitotic spindle midzone localized MAP family member [Pseudozyma flocculosa]